MNVTCNKLCDIKYSIVQWLLMCSKLAKCNMALGYAFGQHKSHKNMFIFFNLPDSFGKLQSYSYRFSLAQFHP